MPAAPAAARQQQRRLVAGRRSRKQRKRRRIQERVAREQQTQSSICLRVELTADNKRQRIDDRDENDEYRECCLSSTSTRQYQASPCCFARVPPAKNVFSKLLRREIASSCCASWRRTNAEKLFLLQRFSRYALRHEFDLFTLSNVFDPVLDDDYAAQQRNEIVELVSVRHLTFAVTRYGTCFVVNFANRRLLYELNDPSSSERIRTIFWNKLTQSLVLVSVTIPEEPSTLRCRAIPFVHISRSNLAESVPLFTSENITPPGFIEFDHINDIALTFSPSQGRYKVWEMKEYTPLFSIDANGVNEVRMSQQKLTVDILSLPDGSLLRTILLKVHNKKEVEFIELVHEKLLVKTRGHNLQIVDIKTLDTREVIDTRHLNASSFIFLHSKRLFLICYMGLITVWNFEGSFVSRLDDHLLLDEQAHTLCITEHQDCIISYCAGDDFFKEGSINVSDVATGKCMAKMEACCEISAMTPPDAETVQTRALTGVTALFYNEERSEIVTGNKLDNFSQ
ncbi:F-box/WD repeat-containing protein 4 [Balamuthia mandrillaris]